MSNAIAVPAAYGADLAPVDLSFDLEITDDELFVLVVDFSQVTSARAVVTRPDGVTLDWALTIADVPAASETTITLTHEIDFADLFDDALAPVAPGAYEIRFLVTDDDGEHVVPGRQWFEVVRL